MLLHRTPSFEQLWGLLGAGESPGQVASEDRAAGRKCKKRK